MSNRSPKLRILVECAMLVAISAVLCIFPKFKFLPYGGSITLCSMLPIVLISYRRGLRWGFLSAFVFALIQILTGFYTQAITLESIVMVVLFDYLVAFMVLGIGGLFRGKFHKPAKELMLGSVVALSLRFVSHIISGYFVWGDYAEWFFGETGAFGAWVTAHISGNALALVYSVLYNASYMLPEILLTALGCLAVSRLALYGLGGSSAVGSETL